jgi:formylglycine-generating enzyme required for sulfatase activity/cellulose biosynthesis protein BcsQ
MALANVAVLLAQWGHNVLIVDWDLEAPGLEFYFKDYLGSVGINQVNQRDGIVDLLQSTVEDPQNPLRWENLVIKINFPEGHKSIDFLSVGKRSEYYFTRLRELDLRTYYTERGGSTFIELLREEWKEKYDFVLVDSRTGITDIGGICTIHLPDILVLLFTANEQSLSGAIDVAKRAAVVRQKLPFERLNLLTIPVPTRFETVEEFQVSQQWLDLFAEALRDLYAGWLPKSIKTRDFLEITKIPHVPYFSFGEKLPVIEQGTLDPSGLGYAFETLAALIANRLQSVEQLIGERSDLVKSARKQPVVSVFSEDIEYRIAELESALATIDLSLTIRQVLEQELQDARAKRSSQGVIDVAGDRVYGSKVAGDRVYGSSVGLNLGTIIYGRTPDEDERRRLVWYLERLSARLNQLPLQGLETRLDRQGAGVALSSVYMMLATQRTVEVARGGAEELQSYYTDGDLDEPLVEAYNPDHALPDQAIVREEPLTTGGERQPAQRVLARALLATEAVQQQPHLVLLGNPGSGKSTFVRHLAWSFAQRELGQLPADHPLPADMPTCLPIIVPLQRLARRLAAEGVGHRTVTAALHAEVAHYDVGPVEDMLNAALQRGAALLLFDGLDEVPLQGEPRERVDRLTTVQAVRAFARLHPTTPMLVTCRVRAFADDLRDCLGWPVETLAPFTLGQVRHFVPAWYAELVVTGQITSDMAARLTPILVESVMAHRQLHEMAQTPLLLTMMALVLYNKGELPRDRPRLYETILELLLGQWDKVHDGRSVAEALGYPERDSERLRPLLDQLSYAAHQRAADGRGRLARRDVRDTLIAFFQQAGMPEAEAFAAAGRFLEYIDHRSGLLTPDTDETYVFTHLTLQEHCAGRHIVLDSEDPSALAMKHRTDDRWREPLFLGMGLAPPADLNDFLDALMGREEEDQLKPLERWYRDLILAAELGEDRDWAYLRTLPRIKVAKLQAALRAGLVELLSDHSRPLPVAERVRAGFLLGDLGDPRMPVTVAEWRRELERARAGDATGYFCLVPAGTYIIGSTADDPEAKEEEQPQHSVEFPQPFLVARFPITNAQWQTWIQASGKQSYFADDDNFNHPNQPVVDVTWHRCNDFCAWLSDQLDITIRLPTEAEWEAAARGGDARRYPWGDEWREDRAATRDDQETHGWCWSVPVGCYPAGMAPSGALDMAGNVDEWTADIWQSYPEAAKPFTDEDRRVLRGGYYGGNRTNVRCGARIGEIPGDIFINYGLGFRVVAALSEP